MQAVGTVHVLIVAYEKFSAFVDANDGADHAFRRMVTRRWNDAESMLRDRSVTSGAQRLAGLLANWRRRGIIRTGLRDLTITDLAALRKIAGQQP